MKRVLCLILAMLMLLSFFGCKQAPEAPEAEAPQEESPAEEATPKAPVITWMTFPADRTLTAKQYFVYDCERGEFLTISGDPDEKIYPASITKLFTAYVANQYLRDTKKVTVGDISSMVVPGSSVAEVKKGDELTVAQLIEAMMLPSGNDAAYVLAIEAGKVLKGSKTASKDAVKAFVAEMNNQAQILGMTKTHFSNPDGIHKEDHSSTFHDLAILGMLSLNDPAIMASAGTAKDTVSLASGEKAWKNTNELIHPDSPYYCPHAIGLKTGQTPSAGSCLLSAFEYEGRTMIIGVFGCPEEEDRFADTLQLFNTQIGA